MDLPLRDGIATNHSRSDIQEKSSVRHAGSSCSQRSRNIDWVSTWAETPPRGSRTPEIESPTSSRSAKSDRYKTELCRQFSENGICRYGDKCQFAHGSAELHTVSRHPKYKTNLCRTFHSTGFCPYGARCHFIHGEASATNPRFNLDSRSVRSSPVEQNPGRLGIAEDHGISGVPLMGDDVDVHRLIRGIRTLMTRSILDSSLHPVLEQRTLTPQRSTHGVLPATDSWPSTFYPTDLMGSTSVSPTLSCSDSPTMSPTSALPDGDIWTSLANLMGVNVRTS